MMLNSLLKISNIISFLFFFASNAYAISFAEVYDATKNHSPEYKSVKATYQAKEAMLTSTTSAYLPRLGLESRYENFDSKYERTRGGTANAFLNWNIFNGFQDYSKRVIARVEFDQAHNDLIRFETNFSWKIKSIYSRTYALQKIVEIYNKAMKNNQQLLASVRNRQSSGLVSQGEYLEFDLFDTKLKLEFSALESEYEVALTELRSMSGLSSISVLSTDLEPTEIDISVSELDQMLSNDQSKLKIESLFLEQAEAQKNLALGGFLPEVDIKVTYGSMGLRETLINPETSVAITARWELFSGFDTLASRKVAMSKIIQADATLKKQRVEYRSHSEQLIKKIKNITDRLKLESNNQGKVEKYWNAVVAEYRRGIRNSSDLKGAAEVALQSSIKIAQLKADYFEAREQLQDLLGIEIKDKK